MNILKGAVGYVTGAPMKTNHNAISAAVDRVESASNPDDLHAGLEQLREISTANPVVCN